MHRRNPLSTLRKFTHDIIFYASQGKLNVFIKLTILLLSCKYAISANLFALDLDNYHGPKEDRHFSNTRSQLDVGF